MESLETSRIYIGGLGDNATMMDLEGMFRDYAPYSEATVLRGFAFIQFPTKEAADRAIQGVNGRLLNGRKLTVKIANDNRQKRLNNQQRPRNNKNQGNGPGQGGRPNNQNMGRRRVGGGDDYMERDRSPIDDNRYNNNNFNQSPNNIPMGGNQMPPSSLPAPEPDSNDCEIIVISRSLTKYAENIEARLKRLGLSVDLLFPNEDVAIGKVLANIASRGTTYAILVTQDNEVHQSITVNVLYGQLAEHRNMPIEDATLFISKDFSEKKRRDKNTGFKNQKNNPVYDAPPLKDKHPEAIQHMINVLAANRQLTVLQYERLINYLADRKDMQIKVELGDEADNVMPKDITSNDRYSQNKQSAQVNDTTKEDEEMLQRKIMEIMNKPSITSVIPEPRPEPVPAINQQGSGSGDFMHDPKVQKALDSLLSGSLFKF